MQPTPSQIIAQALKGSKTQDKYELYAYWDDFLSEKLKFPFEAEVHLLHYCEPISSGDLVKVKKIESYEDLAGLIMEVYKGRSKYHLPLCELEVTDKSSENFKLVDAYNEWFANS